MFSESEKQAIYLDILNRISIKQIEKKYNVSKSTIFRIKKELDNISRDEVDKDLKLHKLKTKTSSLNKKYRNALIELSECQTELEQYREVSELRKSIIIPNDWEVLKKDGKEVVAFTLASDWHVDEIVNPAEIGGVNAYNLDIATYRIEMYFRYVLRLIQMCRHESKIKRLVIGALGDSISGWIHEELMEASALTPPEAIMKVFELWVSGLDFLLEHGELDEIDIICCCGNHSRITQRQQVKRSNKKTYEWILYQTLIRWYAMKGETRIRFKLSEGYFNWLTVFEKDIRFHHGEGIRYLGGVGGIHIPLRKAIAQWNKAKHADLDIMGHWHSRETSRDYVINGSVIGYNEFAQRIKADYAPPEQAFFILHPTFGKTAEFPIVLP